MLLLPPEILTLVLQGSWAQVIVLARWCKWSGVCLSFGPTHWPPADALPPDHDADFLSLKAPDLFSPVKSNLAHDIRRWAPTLLAAAGDEESRIAVEKKLTAHVKILQRATWALQAQRGEFPHSLGRYGKNRIQHSGVALLQCLQAARNIKGGSAALLEMVKRCLLLILPRATVDKCLAAARQLPSGTLLRYYELQLDLSLMLMMRERNTKEAMVVYAMSDSSPQKDYDWLWTLATLVPKKDIILAFTTMRRQHDAMREAADALQQLEEQAEPDDEAIEIKLSHEMLCDAQLLLRLVQKHV